ncbi:MAG: ATP-binding cassette domain-containing protein [Pseudomonadales bacterium]|nr:ATP-binding cassette domain-containing protein [Pseudomonadales bacterium]
MTTEQTAISIAHLDVGYSTKKIISNLDLSIKKGKITALIGPNGCGKSTLLKTISRLLTPSAGTIHIAGDIDVLKSSSKEIARRLALLPQITQSPEGITVKTLVAFGRAPYLNQFGMLKDDDHRQIELAMRQAGVTELADNYIDQLSGGQLQRVWIALILAQDTDILLLDEPTTYLDISHQYELLNLLEELNLAGKTIVIVMHDLNQACRYADELIIMQRGEIVDIGTPQQVFTEKMLREVFNFEAIVIKDPEANTPMSIARVRKNSNSRAA